MVNKDKLVSLLQDRYVIKESLGKGGMGAVWKAYDKFLKIDVAIKIISTESIVLDVVSRFQREAKLSSKLKHQNIISIYDFGLLEDELPYMVLEFFPGQTLEEFLESKGSLDIKDSLPIFKQLADGLFHAHQKGVIHRDLKPANIILRQFDDKFEVKILDFGIAKPSNTEGVETLTKFGSIIGSPLYMSPEQSKSEDIDTRSDIYSLGCVMFTILVGSPPIQGPNALETMFLKMNQKAPKLKEFGVDASELLETIVEKCLAIEPGNRHQFMEEVLDDLKSLEDSLLMEETDEENEDEIQDEDEFSKSKFNKSYVAALSLVLVIVLGGFLYKALIPKKVIRTKLAGETQNSEKKSSSQESGLKYFPQEDLWSLVPGASEKDYQNFKKSAKKGIRALQIKGVMPDQKLLNRIKGMSPRQIIFSDSESVETTVIKKMAQFSRLEELYFKYSNLESKEVLKELSNFSKLTQLKIEDSTIEGKQFTAKDIKLLTEIPSLERLFFIRTLMNRDALRSLSSEHKYELLSLNQLSLNEDDLSFLPNMKLRNLAIHEMPVSPEFFLKLKKMKLDSISLNRILMPVDIDKSNILLKANKIPWKETSVIELSQQFPKTTIGSTYGYYINGVYQKPQNTQNSLAIKKRPSRGPYAWTILHNATKREFYAIAAKKHVNRLDIQERAFDSSTYDLLKGLPLESIELKGIYGLAVPEINSICAIKTINTLKFEGCVLESPEVFGIFPKLPALKRVEIVNCRIENHKLNAKDIGLICKAPTIQTFILRGMDVEPQALNSMPRNRHFREISLDSLNLEDKDLKFLLEMKVDNIGLRSNVVSYDLVKKLLRKRKLTSINLRQVRNEKRESWARKDIEKMSREFKGTAFHSSYGNFRYGIRQ